MHSAYGYPIIVAIKTAKDALCKPAIVFDFKIQPLGYKTGVPRNAIIGKYIIHDCVNLMTLIVFNLQRYTCLYSDDRQTGRAVKISPSSS
jgi:hypothetical protein